MTLKLVLVDDQQLVREGIKSLLKLSDKVEVVAECDNGSKLIDAITSSLPDVILLDLSMPVMDGIQTLKMLRETKITIPVLVVTTFDDQKLVNDSISLGAKGFILKDVSLETLLYAIETIHSGERYYQPAITERVLNQNLSLRGYTSSTDHVETLTAKETEILRFIAFGYANKDIANTLCKSEGTVKNHVSTILSKLNARDRTRAVMVAMTHGLLE